MTKPITPEEIETQQEKSLSEKVINLINQLIVDSYNGEYALVGYRNIYGISSGYRDKPIPKNVLINPNLIISVYKKFGWKVVLKSPNSTTRCVDTYFIFEKMVDLMKDN